MKHKHKPHKGLSKRVKITRSGKVKRGVGGHSHLLSTKNAKRRRKLRTRTLLDNPAIANTTAKALGVYKPSQRSRKRRVLAAVAAAAVAGGTTPVPVANRTKPVNGPRVRSRRARAIAADAAKKAAEAAAPKA